MCQWLLLLFLLGDGDHICSKLHLVMTFSCQEGWGLLATMLFCPARLHTAHHDWNIHLLSTRIITKILLFSKRRHERIVPQSLKENKPIPYSCKVSTLATDALVFSCFFPALPALIQHLRLFKKMTSKHRLSRLMYSQICLSDLHSVFPRTQLLLMHPSIQRLAGLSAG